MTIRELDDATVRKIAAGEVVERPASVVKELVENSVDADASRIDVAVEAGGKDRIRVADDGVGMDREAVRTAVGKHTTSKIRDAADLERIGTLGFRGEALHAIGAVSRMTITTKPRGGGEATELRVEHGEVTGVAPAGRPEGTTVEVTDLFGEMPARRRFLKADATEFDHANRIVTRYALANPGVAVSLIHDDRESFSTAGRGDLREALLAVYGREVAESMIGVDADGVSGYASHPETNRSTREYVSTFVNGRYVNAPTLRNAVVDAYGGQLAPDRYPFAVLFLSVPPDTVDVNVHPRKLEVRFDDGETVRETVRDAVEGALLDHGLVRSSAPRGRSAPDEATVEPGTAADAADSDPASGGGGDTTVGGDVAGDGEADDGRGRPGPDRVRRTGTASTADPADAAGSRDGTAPEPDAGSSGGGQHSTAGTSDRDDGPGTGRGPGGSEADAAAPDSGAEPGRRRIRERGTQTTLDDGRTDEAVAFERLPAMRVLGQVGDTYVVAETDGGLVLIDQHAADERVNYERLRRRVTDGAATQALAEPVELELTAREAALFPEHEDALAEVGFRAERVGERTVEVRAVPAVVSSALDPELLRDVLGEFVEGAGETSVDSRADALLADLACYPSITGHTSLSDGSIRDLLSALDGCENPYACPHGRPVVIEIGRDELDERFERDYPGHA